MKYKHIFYIAITITIAAAFGLLPKVTDSAAAELSLTKVGEWGTGYYRDVFIDGNYAYCAANGAGLDIIDISNPLSPHKIGNFDTPGYAACGVQVTGGYAYVADFDGGLQVIDVNDPANPFLAGNYDTPGSAWGVDVSGGYAYVAD